MKYILLKDYTCPDRNFYAARSTPYDEVELPKAVLNTNLVRPVTEETKITVETVNQNSDEQDVIRLTKDKGTEEITFKVKHTKVTVEAPEPVVVNVNTSSEEDIIAIDGVGAKTAKKVIAARPIESLEELDEKAPLGFGKKWKDLKVNL